jgi:hypothetical protein
MSQEALVTLFDVFMRSRGEKKRHCGLVYDNDALNHFSTSISNFFRRKKLLVLKEHWCLLYQNLVKVSIAHSLSYCVQQDR